MDFKCSTQLPWVVSPALVNVPLEGWRNVRPVMNHETCCRCGVCYLYCPTGCIEDRQDGFEINLDFCKGCGICACECPNHAIRMIEEA